MLPPPLYIMNFCNRMQVPLVVTRHTIIHLGDD